MISHRFTHQWRAAVLVVGALLTLAACGSAPGTKSTPLPSADSVLTKAAQAPLKDATFTLSITGGLGGGDTGVGLLTTTPKRTQTTLDPTSATPQLGRLTDDSGYYFQPPQAADATGPGLWFKTCPSDILAKDPASAFMLLQPDFLASSQAQGAKVLGSETINSAPTWHLRGTRPDTGALARAFTRPETLTEDLWFRQDTAYPVKLVFSFTPTTGGASDYTITLVFTAWDTGAAIPAPVAQEDVCASS